MARKKKSTNLEDPYRKPIEKVSKYNKKALTDNVKFNEMLAPLYFALMSLFLHYNYKIPYVTHFFSSAIFYSFTSTLVYVFVSNYFQPDLDVRTNRPGMSHFPFGRWVGAFKFGRVLKMLAYPITFAWYWLWHPYGKILTHRGAGHWPIWGVWLRCWYLLFWYSILLFILNLVGVDTTKISIFSSWLKSFFPWDENFANFYFVLFAFPIYLSDTVHILVDYYDAVKRSMSFCPPRIARGLISKTINTLRGVR